MSKRDDAVPFEGPANEHVLPGATLPDIVAFELQRHRVEAQSAETAAARTEGFVTLMRAFFARRA